MNGRARNMPAGRNAIAMTGALALAVIVLVACSRGPTPPASVDPTVASPSPSIPVPTNAEVRSFVVELAPGQGPEAIAMAVTAPERVVSSEALFPGVDANDDPSNLAAIHRVLIAGVALDAKPWDVAYRIAERGGFATVEPDRDDTLLAETGRSAICSDSPILPGAADPGWSLLDMRVPLARARPLPPDGKALGEGVRICHPDSGWTHHVDLDHAALDLGAAIDLVDDESDAFDPLGYHGNPGHGTATGSVLISSGGIGSSGGTLPPGVVTGLAPKAKLVPIRALRSVVQVFDSDIARSVRHAVDAQCDVISMSLGGRAFFGLERAIRDAVDRDVIVVAAAGNCVGFVVAPALYPPTIAVAATNIERKPWRGSSYGSAVDIAAPGEDVHAARAAQGTTPVEGGDARRGTSFATAAVAGAAAVWIAFHGEAAIQAAQVAPMNRSDLFRAALQASAVPRRPQEWMSGKYGAGILDLDALLAFPLASARAAPGRSDADVVALIARMFGRDPAVVRESLVQLMGNSPDFEADLARVGGELLDLAARDPRTFEVLLDSVAAGQPRSMERAASMARLQPQMSRTLAGKLAD
jgi:hypothetical protein